MYIYIYIFIRAYPKAKVYTFYCLEILPVGKGSKQEWKMEVKEKGKEKRWGGGENESRQ